jgi:hypothetical protein
MILIISANRDFSSVVAEQVSYELKLACKEVETLEAAKAFLDAAAAVVTDMSLSKLPVPVVSLVGKKPVRLRDILAEIRQALQKGAAGATMSIGRQYRFSALSRQLTHVASGRKADLTDKEMQLLQHIAGAGRRGITREDLLKRVWGFEEDLNTHTLETHIYRLRGKFKEISGKEIIEAVEGKYKLA